MPAFREAARLGADAAEFDVRRSADAVLVVHHDAAVAGVGPIVSIPADELRRRAPWIPTLDEVISACAGMWMNIEIKNSPADPDWDPDDSVLEAVLAHVERAEASDRVLISSFNPNTARRAVGRLPGLQTGLLVDRVVDALQAVEIASEAGHAALHPYWESLEGAAATAVVEAAGRAGIGVVPWTVDDAAEIRRLAEAGVTGIITNVPDVARTTLG